MTSTWSQEPTEGARGLGCATAIGSKHRASTYGLDADGWSEMENAI